MIDKINTIQKPLEDSLCVSASAINTFVQCPAKYLWEYIFKIKGNDKKYIETEEGKQFHKWCDLYYQNHKDITLESLESSKNELNNTYSLNIVNAQINHLNENKSKFEYLYVKATEFNFYSKDKRFIGYIDRIDRLPDNNYCVVDYKPKDKRKYPTNVKRQLAFYTTRINYLIDNNIKYNDMFDGYHITHGLVLGYKDSSHWFFPIEKYTITAMEKQIEKMKTITEFKCKKSILCNWCQYKNILC